MATGVNIANEQINWRVGTQKEANIIIELPKSKCTWRESKEIKLSNLGKGIHSEMNLMPWTRSF